MAAAPEGEYRAIPEASHSNIPMVSPDAVAEAVRAFSNDAGLAKQGSHLIMQLQSGVQPRARHLYMRPVRLGRHDGLLARPTRPRTRGAGDFQLTGSQKLVQFD